MAYATVTYDEVLAYGDGGYVISYDSGKTWQSLTDDEVVAYYARYESIKTTNY